MAAAETDVKIELFMVLRRVEPQLGGHIPDALLVHIVVEGHARVLLDASGHIDAVGAYGSTHGLDGGIGIAPCLPLVHDLADHRPEVGSIDRGIDGDRGRRGRCALDSTRRG